MAIKPKATVKKTATKPASTVKPKAKPDYIGRNKPITIKEQQKRKTDAANMKKLMDELAKKGKLGKGIR